MRLARIASAPKLKPSSDQQLYDEAHRKLRALEVVSSLSLFKEYIERMKAKHGLESPLFDFKGLIQTICNFALRMQEQSGKSELPILILQWAEDITKNTAIIKEVQQYLSVAYRKAGKLSLQAVSSPKFTTPRKIQLTTPLSKVKSETTFYFRGNLQSQVKNLSEKVEEQQLFQSQPSKKKFVIKKQKKEEQVAPPQEEAKKYEEDQNFEWSSSDEEKPKPEPPKISTLEERRQSENRIKFLIIELGIKLEARVIEIKKTKDQIVYPIKSITKMQAIVRRRIEQRRHKIRVQEEKRKKLQERYEELVRKIQGWFRKIKIRRRMIEAAYQLLNLKRRTVYPKKQYKSAILIQRSIRKCLAVKHFVKANENQIRKKLITFKISQVSDKIQNQLFFFSVTWIDQIVQFKLQCYAKKKCDRLLIKPFILDFDEKQFFYIFARLEEYADALKAEIQPNQTVLQIIQYCCKVSQVFVKSIPGKYQLTQDKLHIVKSLQQVQFEDLLYLDNEMNLQMFGFSDFKYSDTYTLDIEQHAYIINNIKQLNQSLKLIVLVQSVFKQRRALNLMRSKVNRRRHIKCSFGVNFKVGYAQVFINQNDEIFARVIYQRKWQITNKMKINQSITKQLGFPCRENFFEIYQIKDGQIVYTEEGQYWVQKEEELTKKRKYFSFAQIECCICVIQRCIRKHLTLKQIVLQRNVRYFQTKQKEFSVQSLVKKVVLSGENPVRAFFMNFSVETDQETQEKIISIDVRSLEHTYQNDYIHPYKQPLFYAIPMGELIIIGQRMMTIGKVAQVKGYLKFDVPNLMEVQGRILDEQENSNQKAEDKKDDTLQARRLWNQHMRKSWIRGIDIELDINQIDKDIQYRGLQKGAKFSACLCIRSQHTRWRRQLENKLMNETDVKSYNQESITEYVRLYKYQSEMGYGEENKEEGKNNLNFLQIRKDEEDQREQKLKEQEQLQKELEAKRKQEEAERLKLEIESKIKLFSEYCVVSSYRVLVTITLNKLTNILGVTAKTESNVSLQCSINLLDILGGEVQIEYLKQHIDISVIKQLVIELDQLQFVSDAKLQEQLLIEQLKWEKLRNRKPQLENVEGEIYNLEDVFINLNKSKSMYENLSDNKYQVFRIRVKRYQDRIHEHVFNLSFRQLIFTVYFDDFPQEFKTHIIPAQLFECNYLMQVIKNRPPEEISKLFFPVLDYIDNAIEITDENTTNFLKIKPYLSRIFMEQFAIRLQRRIKIRSQFLYFQMYRKRSKMNIFLMHRYILLDSIYIKVMFYLTQYVMKIVFQQLNEVNGNGNSIDKKVKQVYYMDLVKQTFDQPQFEQYKMKWIENQGLHMPYYYEQTYKPLIDYILTRIRFENGIQFSSEFTVTQLQTPQPKQRNETILYNMIDAVIKLQIRYKTFKEREKYNLKKSCTDKSLMRQIGKQFNRTVKTIANQIYIVNMYRIVTDVETQITVDMINFSNRKIKYRGIYILDPTEMLNIGQQKMADYILSLVYIENDLLLFQNNAYQEIEQSTIDVSDAKSPNNLKLIIPAPQKVELINHYQQLESQYNPETIYNVVYSGETKCQLQNDDNKNTVQVAVNLTDLRKLYPYLRSDDRIVMKTISESLIEAIQVNNQGQVMVNNQKINPSFIQIEKGEMNIQSSNYKRQITSEKVLAKKTTNFGKQKYLMKISLIERKVAKIMAESVDTTQEHFEMLYQVLAMSLDKRNEFFIEWELSSEDAQQLTHQKNQKSIANEISKRTLVVQDKFIFLALDKVDIQRHHYPTCILFLEKGIRPIQRQFRNRQRLINFRDYKATVKQWKDPSGNFPNNTNLYLDNLKSDQQFIVLSGEDKAKHLMLICWNLSDFQKRMIEIPKQQYQQLLMKSKGQVIKLLTSFVEYKDDALIFNPPQMSQILTKIDTLQYQMKQ